MDDDVDTDVVLCLNPKCYCAAIRADEWTCGHMNCIIMMKTFGTPALVDTYKWHVRILEQAPEYRDRFVANRDAIRASIQKNVTSMAVPVSVCGRDKTQSQPSGPFRTLALANDFDDMLLLRENA